VPLIDTASLLRIADRAAYQYKQIKETLDAISQQGVEYYWETITATDDPDVEIPTLSEYKAVDDDLRPDFAAKMGTQLSRIIGAMEAHFNGDYPNGGVVLQAGGWDGYLTDHDLRVSQYFAELFFACKGYYMIANNVFSEGDDQFARIQVGAGPVIVFTDGVNYGDGDPQNPANGTYFAATQLRVVVNNMGVTNLDLRLSVKDVHDSPTTIDVTVPGGSPPGTVIPIGVATNRFLDVTGAAFKPGGLNGTAGDDVKVVNIKEREIQL